MTTAISDERQQLSFSGHESFPLRYAWLPKGVQGLIEHPDLFGRQDATVLLGVGKNMVGSIRHWGLATSVLEAALPRPNRLEVTHLGQSLFSPDGWDPFLEDIGTLWLIHWNLVSGREKASAWTLAFGKWNAATFTRDQLTDWLVDFVRRSPATRATPSSIRRDVEVFVRTYTVAGTSRELSSEDAFDCPLAELGLIREVEPRLFAFTRAARPSLPNEIFVYALLDYWQHHQPHLDTLSFEVLQTGLFSPGSAFRLSDNALAERLEALPSWTGLVYDETAGTRVVLRTATDVVAPMYALERYFDVDTRNESSCADSRGAQ